MSVKQTGRPSFMEALLPKGAGANAALDRLAGLVKWYRFEKLLAHLRDEEGPGRPGYAVLVLFRALLLQSLYGLSDREVEEAAASLGSSNARQCCTGRTCSAAGRPPAAG